MKICLRPFLLLCVLIVPFSLFAQSGRDTLAKDQNSEAENEAIADFCVQQLLQIEQKSLEDSIVANVIRQQITSLQGKDPALQRNLESRLLLIENNSALLKQKKIRIADSLRMVVQPYPVIGFLEDTLFEIYTRHGSFSASERTVLISEKIKNLATDYGFNLKTLRVIDTDVSSDIVWNDKVIVSVNAHDALCLNESTHQVAQRWRDIITKDVINYKSKTETSYLVKQIGFSVLILLAFVVLVILLNKLFRRIRLFIFQGKKEKLKGIKIKSYTVLDSDRLSAVLAVVANLIKWVVIITLFYAMLTLIFGFLPWTENIATTLWGYILSPVKRVATAIWYYLPNLFTLFVIVIIFRYVIKAFAYLKGEVEKGKLILPGFHAEWANPTFQLVRILLLAFMFILIFPYLPGSDSPVFQGVSVFLGFIFTFGSASSLSNLMSGLVITYMRLFKIGDSVKIGDTFGDVVQKNLLVTRIRTPKNEIVSIPNTVVMSKETINYSSNANETGLIIHTTVTIGYDVPWKDIESALITAAKRTTNIQKVPEPFVLQTSLDDFYVSYQLNAFTAEANSQPRIYSDLHRHIQDCCNEMGIEIMSPHYRAGRDGNATTIPAQYLAPDYKAPGFTDNGNK